MKTKKRKRSPDLIDRRFDPPSAFLWDADRNENIDLLMRQEASIQTMKDLMQALTGTPQEANVLTPRNQRNLAIGPSATGLRMILEGLEGQGAPFPTKLERRYMPRTQGLERGKRGY